MANRSTKQDKRTTRADPRSAGKRQSKPRCVVATEGKVTEPEYLALLKDEFPDWLIVPKVTDKGNHSYENLLGRLNEERKRSDDERDQCWILLDMDENDLGNLNTLWEQANAKGYKIALSNPCFEIWLLLHFTNEFPSTRNGEGSVYKKLAPHLPGYGNGRDKSKALLPHHPLLRPGIYLATEHAHNRSKGYPEDEKLPCAPGSHLFKLIGALKGEI